MNYTISSFFTKLPERKVIFAFLLIVFLICIKDGVIFSPDSYSYINHSIIRIGLYPLITSFFQYILTGYAFKALVTFQLIFILLTSYCLANLLKLAFKLPFFLYWLLMSAFLSPLFIYNTGNEIMSEGIAYPLFLLTSYFLLKGFLQQELKYFIYFSLTAFLLCFARQQYAFFYGIAFFSLFLFHFFATNFHKKGLFFLSILLSLGTLFTAERACHYIYHDAFSTTPFIGSQLIVRPLFLATSDTYKKLKDPKHQQIIKETVDEVLRHKIVPANPQERGRDQYMNAYGPIALIFVNLRAKIWPEESFNKGLSSSKASFTYAQFLDQQSFVIARQLIKSNLANFIKSYIKDIIGGFGGYSFFAISLFIVILCLWNILWHRSKSIFNLFFILSSLSHLGNLIIICLFEPPLMRYIYSTGLLLFNIYIIMTYQALKKEKL